MSGGALQLRDEMLAYLQAFSSPYFGPADIMDYTGIGQIWVNAVVIPDCCRVRMLYNYMNGDNRIEFPIDAEPATTTFYSELATIAAFWGNAVAANNP